jgi:hypothetical protein
LPSLDLIGLHQTLPRWSLTMRPRRGSNGSINVWQWTVGGNSLFDLTRLHGNAWLAMTGVRLWRWTVRRLVFVGSTVT